jgi:hypothetical protein
MRADGSESWVSGSAKPEIHPDGSVLWSGYVRHITYRHKVELALKRKSALLQLLNETALEFINVPVAFAHSAIDKALEGLGRFFGVDRAYLFEYDFGKLKTCNTHEWCAEGIEPFKDQLQDQPIEWDSEWYSQHLQGEVVNIPDVDAMPSCSVKNLLTMRSIRSLLKVPLMHQDKPIGFVGFDAVSKIRTFSAEEIMLLKVFARARKLVVPPQLEPVAIRLTQTELRPGTADNDVNAIKGTSGGLPEGFLTNDFLTSSRNWFLLTNIDGLSYMERIKFETDMQVDFVTDNLLVKGYERYSFGYYNWRSIWGSLPS